MIPLKDNIPTKSFPIITVSLIIVNILIFLWQRFFLSPAEIETVYRLYGLVPKELSLSIHQQRDLIPYNILTIFSSMFIHGGFLHLGGNMLYLWIFGNNIEDSMGYVRFPVFYLLSGVIAALFQYLYDPTSTIPMVGASGAVSGVLGAYLLLYPYARISTLIFIFIVQLPAVVLLTIWFIMQVFYSQFGHVAWYAHIGGFIFGLLAIRFFIKKQRIKKSPRRRRPGGVPREKNEGPSR